MVINRFITPVDTSVPFSVFQAQTTVISFSVSTFMSFVASHASSVVAVWFGLLLMMVVVWWQCVDGEGERDKSVMRASMAWKVVSMTRSHRNGLCGFIGCSCDWYGKPK